MTSVLRRLRDDARGVTIVEFAIVAPVIIILIMGLLDLAYRQYATSILHGAMQKAARDSALEGGGTAATTLDNKVRSIFKEINSNVPDSGFVFTRRNFRDFSPAGRLERQWSDTPTVDCPGGVYYRDENNSNSRDDGGMAGQGNAKDVVLYSVTVQYPSPFPLPASMAQHRLVASTVLRNQPFGDQIRPPHVARCLS